jgi:hypothetical protein
MNDRGFSHAINGFGRERAKSLLRAYVDNFSAFWDHDGLVAWLAKCAFKLMARVSSKFLLAHVFGEISGAVPALVH